MFESSLEFINIIRDPIWGEIPITRLEEKIIKTRAFSRLRNIKQMSMAYLGFVGAQHTRYEHSIGTMHVAYKLASGLSVLPDTNDNRECLRLSHHSPLSTQYIPYHPERYGEYINLK